MTHDDAEPITLYPDRRPAIALALLAVAAVVAGAVLAWRGWGFVGNAAMVAGAVVLLGALAWMIPSRAYLHLTDRGFRYCTAFNPRQVDWRDVERFGVVAVDGRRRVAWDYVSRYPADIIDRERTKARTGFEALLPRCCRMRSDQMAELLERRRRRVVGGIGGFGARGASGGCSQE